MPRSIDRKICFLYVIFSFFQFFFSFLFSVFFLVGEKRDNLSVGRGRLGSLECAGNTETGGTGGDDIESVIQ